jgi:hypothetical protein
MVQDDVGTLWLGTDRGVGRFDDGELIGALTTSNGLPADQVRSATKDKDGALWFGTLGGVGRYDTLTWQSYFRDQTIVGIATGPLGRLWVATSENGLRYLQSGEWHSVTADDHEGGPHALPGNWIEVLFQAADGALWVGTNTFGLSRYDGQAWRTFTQAEDGLSSDVITVISEDSGGTLWAGTNQGLNRYDGGGWQPLDVGAECGLESNFILALAEDVHSALWIGTQAGVCRHDGERWLGTFTSDTSGLAANEVRAIHRARDGKLWFGTWAGGVSQYDGERWQTLTVADGLATNAIFSITEGPSGEKWLGTLTGVSRTDGRTWLSYTTADGLASNVVRVIYQDSGGVVWMGTEEGLTRYDPDPGTPIARVESLNGIPYVGGTFTILTGDPLDINYSGGDLRTAQEDLVFLCYLERVDPGWQPCRSLSYSGLPHGNHLFHLTVRDEDFNYSPEVTVSIAVNRGVALAWLGRSFVVPVSAFAIVVTVALSAVTALALYVYTRRQVRRRGRGALRRKFNPYISGEPVRREDMFFGRSDLMRRIMDTLHNNSIMIHGERRIGKTTLLYQLANRLRGDTDPEYFFVPVLVDLEGTPGDALFHTLMEGIVWTCLPLLPGPPDLTFNAVSDQRYGDRDFGRDLSIILAGLKSIAGKEVRIILLMDEMDAIDGYGRMVQLQLRRVFMKDFPQSVGAIVAGVRISRTWDRPESPWYNLFVEMQMPPFSEEEARELITEPVKGIYRYEEQAVRRIIHYGRGRPYRVQHYCLEAVNHMLADGRSKVKLTDVEHAHSTIARNFSGDTGD